VACSTASAANDQPVPAKSDLLAQTLRIIEIAVVPVGCIMLWRAASLPIEGILHVSDLIIGLLAFRPQLLCNLVPIVLPSKALHIDMSEVAELGLILPHSAALLFAAYWGLQIAMPVPLLRKLGLGVNTSLAVSTALVGAMWTAITRY